MFLTANATLVTASGVVVFVEANRRVFRQANGTFSPALAGSHPLVKIPANVPCCRWLLTNVPCLADQHRVRFLTDTMHRTLRGKGLREEHTFPSKRAF